MLENNEAQGKEKKNLKMEKNYLIKVVGQNKKRIHPEVGEVKTGFMILKI